MPLAVLNNRNIFPPVNESEPDGLLAIGGDLSPDRIITAYKQGIFPWYSGEHILWWSPDPRFVLFPDELKVSKSMKKLLAHQTFKFTTNTAFKDVIDQCKTVPRKDQEGTWITDEMKDAYTNLHKMGYAHSAEVWQDDKLVGGLYGVRIGKVFFGESMFSLMPNASKYAFISYVNELKKEGIELIDCQVYTEHLESLGAKMINRNDFISKIKELV